MTDKLIISFQEYTKIVEKLAIQIHKSGFKPDILLEIDVKEVPVPVATGFSFATYLTNKARDKI